MKLLIITQRISLKDDVLGFFHGWIRKSAKQWEKVTVICLQKADYELPQNVSILSLGKEQKRSKLKYLVNFYKFIWRERKNYDVVFVHMNPQYIVLGGLLWKCLNKKIALWYTHKAVNLKLRIAEKLTDIIFTASKESFRLESKKLVVTGHGIDVNLFKPSVKRETSKNFRILSVGRVSLIKDYETLIKTIDILINQKNIKNLEVKIIGRPILNRDKDYFEKIKELINEKKLTKFINLIGGLPYQDLPSYYQKTDILVNLCSTGGADKSVLEAMACQIPTFVCNHTFEKELGLYKKMLFFKEKNAEDLARKILKIRNIDRNEIGQFLRQQVIKYHSLDSLINKIILRFK